MTRVTLLRSKQESGDRDSAFRHGQKPRGFFPLPSYGEDLQQPPFGLRCYLFYNVYLFSKYI